MKFFSIVIVLFSALLVYAAEFPLRAGSVHQRGVLSVGNSQRPVELFLKSADTIRVMLVCEFGNMAKIELSKNGEILLLENGAFMSRFDAENFFARDVKMALGFLSGLSDGAVYVVSDSRALPSKVACKGECAQVEFSNYKKNDNLFIPENVKISRKNYTLTLKTIRIF